MLEKQRQITEELGTFIQEAEGNFMLKKAMAPIRLVYVWIKTVNESMEDIANRLQALEQQAGVNHG